MGDEWHSKELSTMRSSWRAPYRKPLFIQFIRSVSRLAMGHIKAQICTDTTRICEKNWPLVPVYSHIFFKAWSYSGSKDYRNAPQTRQVCEECSHQCQCSWIGVTLSAINQSRWKKPKESTAIPEATEEIGSLNYKTWTWSCWMS